MFPGLSLVAPAKGLVPEGLEGLGWWGVTLDGSLVVRGRDFAFPPMLQNGTGIYENRPLIRILLETFFADLPTQDFSAIVTRINALDTVPDAILIKVTGETSYNLQQQLYEGGIDITQTIVVANQVALNHDEFWQNVPDGAFAVVPRIGPWASSATETGLAFAEAYRARMGRFPEAYAFEAYDSLHLMADAIERAGSLDPDAIIAALEARVLMRRFATILVILQIFM